MDKRHETDARRNPDVGNQENSREEDNMADIKGIVEEATKEMNIRQIIAILLFFLFLGVAIGFALGYNIGEDLCISYFEEGCYCW